MKKAILILAAILLTSCSKEDEVCKCTGMFITEENPYDVFYIDNFEIDCEIIKPIKDNPNGVFIGCK